MKKTITQILSLILFITFFSQDRLECQNINLDNIEISIGDSLESVIKKFATPYYSFQIDTSHNYLRYSIFKRVYNYSDNNELHTKLLGRMYFAYYSAGVTFYYRKELYQVQKIWNSNTSKPIDVLRALTAILEKNTIDNYSVELTTLKNIEPDQSSNTIHLQINPNTLLRIYYMDNDYYEISEIVTKNDYKHSKKEYILVFEDAKHFWGEENYIIEYFKREEDAKRRIVDLQIPYVLGSDYLFNYKIIRFYKNRD